MQKKKSTGQNPTPIPGQSKGQNCMNFSSHLKSVYKTQQPINSMPDSDTLHLPPGQQQAVCSQDTGGSSQCNQARQRKGVQVREEATLSLLTDGNPEGSIKRLLEGVARCKINIQKSIVPATYNQEMN